MDHMKLIAKIAAQVHHAVRRASLPEDGFGEDGKESTMVMLGAQAGFFSAGVSAVSDLAEAGLISMEDGDECGKIALELCTQVQCALQRQVILDLKEAGADIPDAAIAKLDDPSMLRFDEKGNEKKPH